LTVTLSKAEKLEAAATVYEMMLAGESDDRIMSSLGMSVELFREAKKFMLEQRASEVRGKPREHVYVEYTIEQRSNIRALDTLIDKLDGLKQSNALVGAIRLRTDLVDRILERGFDLGIVRKTAEQHELIGGLAVAQMSAEDLRKAISDVTGRTADLMLKSGDVDIMAIETGELHRGEALVEASVDPDAAIEDDEADMVAEVVTPIVAPVERRKATAPIVVAKKPAKRK
jgi:hypothetical protein